MHPLERDIQKLTSLIENKFSRGMALNDELPRLRALLKLQIVGAESLGDALPASYADRAGELPISTPGDNTALLKTEWTRIDTNLNARKDGWPRWVRFDRPLGVSDTSKAWRCLFLSIGGAEAFDARLIDSISGIPCLTNCSVPGRLSPWSSRDCNNDSSGFFFPNVRTTGACARGLLEERQSSNGRPRKPNGLIGCETLTVIRDGSFRSLMKHSGTNSFSCVQLYSNEADREVMNLPFNRSGAQEMRIRKQVYELTLQDLSASPTWEFRLDHDHNEGRDESTVRPYPKAGVLDPTDRMFVVRAVFTLADGSQMHGYLSPPGRGEEGLGALQPIIVTERGQVRFWCGRNAPDSKRLAQSYEWLGKSAIEVFPAQFKSDVELVGGPLVGIVPGFLVLEDFQTRRTRTVR